MPMYEFQPKSSVVKPNYYLTLLDLKPSTCECELLLTGLYPHLNNLKLDQNYSNSFLHNTALTARHVMSTYIITQTQSHARWLLPTSFDTVSCMQKNSKQTQIINERETTKFDACSQQTCTAQLKFAYRLQLSLCYQKIASCYSNYNRVYAAVPFIDIKSCWPIVCTTS